MVLILLVILENVYPELALSLPENWMARTDVSSVPFSKADAIVVLQRVMNDPVAQRVSISVECENALATQCEVIVNEFSRSASDEVAVYSVLSQSDYMDAGNIAIFLARKLERKTYVRTLACTENGDRNDDELPFPNHLDHFDVDLPLLQDVVGAVNRDWRWQVAYMTGIGAGHTCLLVDTHTSAQGRTRGDSGST